MIAGAEASVWSERMLSALENGVKGGTCFSLMDTLSKTAPPTCVRTQDADAGLAASRPSAPPARRAVISPLLASIYLDPLDKLMVAQGYRMVRCADDFVVLCKSREEADVALFEVPTWVTANGLMLHPSCPPPAGAPSCPPPAGRAQDEPRQVERQHPGQNRPHAGRAPAARDCRSQPGVMPEACVPHVAAGSGPSAKLIIAPSALSMVLSGGGCARSCASRRNGRDKVSVMPIIDAGPMPTSRTRG